MFRWLKTGLAGLMPEECDELENYVLTWEIHGRCGSGMWTGPTIRTVMAHLGISAARPAWTG